MVLKPWSEVGPTDLVSKVQDFYDMICREVEPNCFENRFFYFDSHLRSRRPLLALLDRHPIEAGIFLCVRHPNTVSTLPPGYFSWAYACASLLNDLRAIATQPHWNELKGMIAAGLGVKFGTEHQSLNDVFFQARVFDHMTRVRERRQNFELLSVPV
jgi:hypothetical protein